MRQISDNNLGSTFENIDAKALKIFLGNEFDCEGIICGAKNIVVIHSRFHFGVREINHVVKWGRVKIINRLRMRRSLVKLFWFEKS